MKQKNTILILFILCFFNIKAQNNRVYYFERIKIIKNGNQQKANGDGHYLAINSNGLYECDYRGSSMSKGFVKFINTNNNRPYYEGNAFWGQNLIYVFNNDYSRLNLHLGNGTIYVYTSRQSPSSSSALRSYKTESVAVPVSYTEIPIKSTSNMGKSHSGHKTIVCPYCNGTGKRRISTDGGIRSNQYWITCGECGQRYLNTNTHRHISCSYCNGTGKRRL